MYVFFAKKHTSQPDPGAAVFEHPSRLDAAIRGFTARSQHGRRRKGGIPFYPRIGISPLEFGGHFN